MIAMKRITLAASAALCLSTVTVQSCFAAPTESAAERVRKAATVWDSMSYHPIWFREQFEEILANELKLDKGDRLAWLYRGKVLQEKSEYPGAEKSFKAALGSPEVKDAIWVRAKAGLGDVYCARGKWAEAVKEYIPAARCDCDAIRNDEIDDMMVRKEYAEAMARATGTRSGPAVVTAEAVQKAFEKMTVRGPESVILAKGCIGFRPGEIPFVTDFTQFNGGNGTLKQVADALKNLTGSPKREFRLEVSGHVSVPEKADQSLAWANAVRDYLIAKGVKKEYIRARGYGCASRVADPKDTKNDRIEMRFVSFNPSAPNVSKWIPISKFTVEYDKGPERCDAGGKQVDSGQQLSIDAETDAPCFMRIYAILPDRSSRLLFPTNLSEKSSSKQIRTATAHASYVNADAPGMTRLVVIASSTPQALAKDAPLGLQTRGYGGFRPAYTSVDIGRMEAPSEEEGFASVDFVTMPKGWR